MKQNHFTAVVIGDDHNNIMANYDKCTNVTNQHKANVLALTSIQDYDYKTDYPLKLQFN